ncbi:MAG: alpha/beta hydrolase [Pseudomonadota bacterium]
MADTRAEGRYEMRRIDTGRITLNIRSGGSGPLMVFFHGITANSAVFEPMMDAFSDDFTTVAVDQRGHGHSDKPESGYAADDYADDIAALIKALDLGPAILVGHSLGSRNSVTAAARHPDLVRCVIAIDFTPYIEDEVFDTLTARVNSGNQVFDDLGAVVDYLANRYPNIPAPAIRIRAKSGYGPVEGGGLRPFASALAMAQTAHGLRADLRPAFRDVPRPVLVVRGANSKLVTAAALEKTHALRPDMPISVVPDADHYVHETNLSATIGAIRNFVDS